MKPEHAEILRGIDPAEVNNASFEGRVIDVSEAAYVEYRFHTGTMDVALTELKIQESDTKTDDTTLDSPTDLVDWSDDKTDPSATDDDKVFVIGIDMTRRGPRKKFQQPVATAGNGTNGVNLCCEVVVWRSGDRDSDAASRGDVEEVLYD